MDEIQTERLSLRPTRLSDAADLFAFLGDAEAMRHTHHLATLCDCRRHVARHERQRRRIGCAPWAVLDRIDGRLVGYGGVFVDPFDPDWGLEVGYWFAPSAWGRGYATELTEASLRFARDRLGLSEIQAFAKPENAASRRVLEKAGFEHAGFIPELERYRYLRRLGGADPIGS